MDYDKIIKECEARAEMYKRTGAVWNATHEEQCKTTIAELIERAEQAEKERDEYKELFFSYKHVCGGVDPQRIGELVEADKDGRCVVLHVKPGDKVRPKQSPYRKSEIVDCVSIYTGGRITYGFHEVGMKETWVDRWEEEESEMYIPDDTAETTLKEKSEE